MALINCPECSKEISDKAKACPHCGAPVKALKSPEEIEKRKGRLKAIIIAVVIVSIIGGCVAGGFYLKHMKEKRLREEYENSEAYKELQETLKEIEKSHEVIKGIRERTKAHYDNYSVK